MTDAAIDPETLPRLLYIADVPVENSLHGSSLLYRLLLRYPKDRLLIVETGAQASLPARRLPGVEYRFVRQPLERLRRTRLTSLVQSAAMMSATARTRAIDAAAGNFAADAVLTVTHGDAWLSALSLARMRGLPYHLICHDEWASGGATLRALRGWRDRAFAKAYRGAVSRLCVSPAMVEAYRDRYGVAGETLYPARSPDARIYEDVSPRLAQPDSGRVIAFAGSMNTAAMVDANVRLAEAIAPLGGTLMIFGPATVESYPRLCRPSIVLRGLLPPEVLGAVLRSEVDALFLPMWFGDAEKENERLCFPSKLTDYTNVGLPIFVSGDADCAAATWARLNPGVALVQSSQESAAMAADVSRIFEDRGYARALAQRAKRVGDVMFAAAAAEHIFYHALGQRL